jgi:hypothetical protein
MNTEILSNHLIFLFKRKNFCKVNTFFQKHCLDFLMKINLFLRCYFSAIFENLHIASATTADDARTCETC